MSSLKHKMITKEVEDNEEEMKGTQKRKKMTIKEKKESRMQAVKKRKQTMELAETHKDCVHR